MAVFCEFISVIIRRDSIDKYFQGGWNSFVLELPNYSMCTDGEVVNVGFMNPTDTVSYLDFLKSEGLQYDQSYNRTIDDVEVIDRFDDHNEKRSWVEFGDRKFKDQEYFCCWFKGSSIDTLALPDSDSKGGIVKAMPRHMEPDAFAERFDFLRSENDLDIFLDSKYKGEFFLPKGMNIADHYNYFLEWRKEVGQKRKIKDKKTLNSSNRFSIEDVDPEDYSDQIGKKLKEYIENPLNPQKKEKREILDRLKKEGRKQGYISFRGFSHRFFIGRVGDSYLYDVPSKKTGNLRIFRNQKIRVICVGSGTRFIRYYIAGPLE